MSDIERYRDPDVLVPIIDLSADDVRFAESSISARVHGFAEAAVILELDRGGWGTVAVPGISPSEMVGAVGPGDEVRLVVDKLPGETSADTGTQPSRATARLRHTARGFWASYYARRRGVGSAALRGSPRFLFCTPDGSVAFFAETFVRQLNDAGPRQSVPAERLVIHVVLSGDGDDALNISTAPPEHADGLETLLESEDGRRAKAERDAIVGAGAWLRAVRGDRKSLRELADEAASTASTLSLVERGLGERGPTVALVARVLFAVDRAMELRDDAPGRIVVLAAPFRPPFADGTPTDALDDLLRSSECGRRAVAERDAIVRVGRFLRDLRGGRPLREVAGAAGTNEATLSLLERGLGERGPTVGLVGRVAWALDRSLVFEAADA